MENKPTLEELLEEIQKVQEARENLNRAILELLVAVRREMKKENDNVGED